MFVRTAASTIVDKKKVVGNNKLNQTTSFIKWISKKKLFIAMTDKLQASEMFEFFEKKGIDSHLIDQLSTLDMFHPPSSTVPSNFTFSTKMLYKQHAEHFTTDFSFDSLFKSSSENKRFGEFTS